MKFNPCPDIIASHSRGPTVIASRPRSVAIQELKPDPAALDCHARRLAMTMAGKVNAHGDEDGVATSPVDSQGTAATTISPTVSAPKYGQIRFSPTSAGTRPMMQAA